MSGPEIKFSTLSPIASHSVTGVVENGWEGNKPLPVIDSGEMRTIVFVPNKKALEILNGPQPSAFVLIMAKDGSLSLEVQEIAFGEKN